MPSKIGKRKTHKDFRLHRGRYPTTHPENRKYLTKRRKERGGGAGTKLSSYNQNDIQQS